MDEDNELPPHVVALFRELECVLEDAQRRLDAMLRAAIPVQDTCNRTADPGNGGR